MKTAKFLGIVNQGSSTGSQKHYHLDPPIVSEPWDDDEDGEEHDYVVVSATNAMFSGPETYIFGADKDGKIVNWTELPGSFKGGLNHEFALGNAGYEVIA